MKVIITGWGQELGLKAIAAKNLPKPAKVALRTRDKVAQSQEGYRCGSNT
jgi:hypothetical protein